MHTTLFKGLVHAQITVSYGLLVHAVTAFTCCHYWRGYCCCCSCEASPVCSDKLKVAADPSPLLFSHTLARLWNSLRQHRAARRRPPMSRIVFTVVSFRTRLSTVQYNSYGSSAGLHSAAGTAAHLSYLIDRLILHCQASFSYSLCHIVLCFILSLACSGSSFCLQVDRLVLLSLIAFFVDAEYSLAHLVLPYGRISFFLFFYGG